MLSPDSVYMYLANLKKKKKKKKVLKKKNDIALKQYNLYSIL